MIVVQTSLYRIFVEILLQKLCSVVLFCKSTLFVQKRQAFLVVFSKKSAFLLPFRGFMCTFAEKILFFNV